MPASPYWNTRKPSIADIRGRMEDIINGIPIPQTEAQARTQYNIPATIPLGSSFETWRDGNQQGIMAAEAGQTQLANSCCCISSFQFLKEALSKVDPPPMAATLPHYQVMRAFVLRDSTIVTKNRADGDICNWALEAEDKYSLFVCYPIRTQARGAIGAYILEYISLRLMDGFNGMCFGRSYSAFCKGIEWYDVDSNWAVMEVSICVPYTVGAMDNPNYTQGVSFDTDLRAGFADAQDPQQRYAITTDDRDGNAVFPSNPTQHAADSTWHATDDFGTLSGQRVWVITVYKTVYSHNGVVSVALSQARTG